MALEGINEIFILILLLKCCAQVMSREMKEYVRIQLQEGKRYDVIDAHAATFNFQGLPIAD